MKKSPSPLAGEVTRRIRGEVRSGHIGPTPTWLWVPLLIGAAVTLWWAWFVSGFLSEPSSVGRVLVVLMTSICLSALSGLAAAAGAMGLLRREPWGRPLAWIAAITLTLSGAGAIGGIPALVGLFSSREPATP